MLCLQDKGSCIGKSRLPGRRAWHGFGAWFWLSKGITQKQLADNSGVNIRQIQRIESGGSDMGNVTLKNAVAIADALGVDVKMFVEE